jgi:hypothetical protein
MLRRSSLTTEDKRPAGRAERNRRGFYDPRVGSRANVAVKRNGEWTVSLAVPPLKPVRRVLKRELALRVELASLRRAHLVNYAIWFGLLYSPDDRGVVGCPGSGGGGSCRPEC